MRSDYKQRERERDRQTDRETERQRDIRVGVYMCPCGFVGRGNIVHGYGCVGGQDENSECMCAEC